MSVESKKLDHCRDCLSFHTGGIKDGKHNRWCTHFGIPAIAALGRCVLLDAKTIAPAPAAL